MVCHLLENAQGTSLIPEHFQIPTSIANSVNKVEVQEVHLRIKDWSILTQVSMGSEM